MRQSNKYPLDDSGDLDLCSQSVNSNQFIRCFLIVVSLLTGNLSIAEYLGGSKTRILAVQ